jgi:uncharacterized protein (TIGR03435 family)
MRVLPLVVGLRLVMTGVLPAQSPPPAFAVASINACKPGEVAPGVEAGSTGRGKSTAGNAAMNSPVTLALPCRPLRILIAMAYIEYAGGRQTTVRRAAHLEGGPAWVQDALYVITAKADSAVTPAMMRGPMLQVLLEDRFRLRIRHETRQGEVYDLTVAKNGPKLRPTQPGSCVPRDLDQVRLAASITGGKPWCSTVRYVSSMKTMTGILDGAGVTIAEMAPYFSTGNVIPVIAQANARATS